MHFKLHGTKNNPKLLSLNTRSVLQEAIDEINSSNARIEAELLMCHALGRNRTYLLSHFDEDISKEKKTLFLSYVHRRKKGEPISYITGKREFYGLTFQVNESVLIPRPETELLVELTVKEVEKFVSSPTILDMCTGSGAIAVALAKNCPKAKIDAVDISIDAVRIAQKNAQLLKVDKQVCVFQSDCFTNVDKKYNVIVSNPPYIPTDQLNSLPMDVKREPVVALDGGCKGLEFIRRMVNSSVDYLLPKGLLLFEISGDFQKDECIDILESNEFSGCFYKKDLASIVRVCGGYYD